MLGQVFQPMLEQMKAVYGKSMGVLSSAGTVVASVGESIHSDAAGDAVINNTANGKPYVLSDYTFVSFGVRNMMDYVAYVKGSDAESQKQAQGLAIALSNLQVHCGDKYDKINYLKNVLLGNVMPGDVFLHSAELQVSHLPVHCP